MKLYTTIRDLYLTEQVDLEKEEQRHYKVKERVALIKSYSRRWEIYST